MIHHHHHHYHRSRFTQLHCTYTYIFSAITLHLLPKWTLQFQQSTLWLHHSLSLPLSWKTALLGTSAKRRHAHSGAAASWQLQDDAAAAKLIRFFTAASHSSLGHLYLAPSLWASERFPSFGSWDRLLYSLGKHTEISLPGYRENKSQNSFWLSVDEDWDRTGVHLGACIGLHHYKPDREHSAVSTW